MPMRPTTPAELHAPIRFTDCLLTMDTEHWCSPSYRGMSSRSELWMTSLGWLLVSLLLLLPVNGYQPLMPALFCLSVLFTVACFFPLLIRRSRQMGALWYGVFVLISGGLHVLHLLLGGAELCPDACAGVSLLIASEVSHWLFPLALLPLYLYGGTFAGRKNLLMRAAIEGDRALVARCLRDYPSALRRKSEKGYTAYAYALLSGHHELAEWLKEQERALPAAPHR